MGGEPGAATAVTEEEKGEDVDKAQDVNEDLLDEEDEDKGAGAGLLSPTVTHAPYSTHTHLSIHALLTNVSTPIGAQPVCDSDNAQPPKVSLAPPFQDLLALFRQQEDLGSLDFVAIASPTLSTEQGAASPVPGVVRDGLDFFDFGQAGDAGSEGGEGLLMAGCTMGEAEEEGCQLQVCRLDAMRILDRDNARSQGEPGRRGQPRAPLRPEVRTLLTLLSLL
jgi:hypothetical protein